MEGKTVIALFNVLSKHFSRRTEGKYEKSVKTAGLRAEILNQRPTECEAEC